MNKPAAPAQPILVGSAITCLAACDNANNVGSSYKPAAAFYGQTARLIKDGYLIRSPLRGGFWITDKGRREITLVHAARLLRKMAKSAV